jgi:hypothetical protein
VLEGVVGDDSDYEEFMVGLRASFDVNVERMLANNLNIMLVDFPACCVRPPGVEFPKPPYTPLYELMMVRSTMPQRRRKSLVAPS